MPEQPGADQAAPPSLSPRGVAITCASKLASDINHTLKMVQGYLLSDESTSKTMPPLPTDADADWSFFSHFLLSRVEACNRLPGPRMRVVYGRTLAELGRVPRWPDDREHILDAEALLQAHIANMDSRGKVEGRIPCLAFFSHRWLQPVSETGRPDPDSQSHEKAKALAQYWVCGKCPLFEHHTFEYYFWIDFSSIDQDVPVAKMHGICKLPVYVASCVKAIFYNSVSSPYEPRAWTRTERMIAYTYTQCPLFVYMDENYPKKPVDIDALVKQQPKVFSKHPETDSLLLTIMNPIGEGAEITDPKDIELIKKLMDIMKTALPLNPAQKMAMSQAQVETSGEFIKFGETKIGVDTEHYSVDAKALERLTRTISTINSDIAIENIKPLIDSSLCGA